MSPIKSESELTVDQPDNEQPVSKSQLKRDAQLLKSLASDLLKLNASQLARVPLDGDVLLAIQDAQKFRSHGARKRQLQYIAKLIRRNDASIILDVMGSLQTETRGLTANLHRVEAWREALLENGDAALAELLKGRVDVDVQAIRQLMRKGRLEKIADKPPSAARKLFRVLRNLDAEQDLPPIH